MAVAQLQTHLLHHRHQTCRTSRAAALTHHWPLATLHSSIVYRLVSSTDLLKIIGYSTTLDKRLIDMHYIACPLPAPAAAPHRPAHALPRSSNRNTPKPAACSRKCGEPHYRSTPAMPIRLTRRSMVTWRAGSSDALWSPRLAFRFYD
jgi:hypothetical protein